MQGSFWSVGLTPSKGWVGLTQTPRTLTNPVISLLRLVCTPLHALEESDAWLLPFLAPSSFFRSRALKEPPPVPFGATWMRNKKAAGGGRCCGSCFHELLNGLLSSQGRKMPLCALKTGRQSQRKEGLKVSAIWKQHEGCHWWYGAWVGCLQRITDKAAFLSEARKSCSWRQFSGSFKGPEFYCCPCPPNVN